MTARVNRPRRKPGPSGNKVYERALQAKPLIDNGMSIRQTAIYLGVDAGNLRRVMIRHGLIPERKRDPKFVGPPRPVQFICPECECAGEKAPNRKLCIPCYKEYRAAVCNSYYRRVKAPQTKKYKAGKEKTKTLIQTNTRFLSMPMRASA
jgi:hypothetical protein